MSDKIEFIRLCRVLQSNFYTLANQNRGHSCVMLECAITAKARKSVLRMNMKYYIV